MKEKPKVTKVDNDESGDKKHRLVLPQEKYVRNLLPKKSTLQIMYSGKKLNSQFNIKDKTNFKHQCNLIYHVNCPLPTCEENYIGETAHRIHERIKDRCRSKQQHMQHMLHDSQYQFFRSFCIILDNMIHLFLNPFCVCWFCFICINPLSVCAMTDQTVYFFQKPPQVQLQPA